jgi:ADP-ribosylglycohydrolase
MIPLAAAFVAWSRRSDLALRAPGNACLAGCRAIAAGVPWAEAGGPEAGGCGSVMRAYPFGLAFADDAARAERFAVAQSRLTHNDPIALAASAAMAVGVALAVNGESVALVVDAMIAAAARYSQATADMMARARDEAGDGTEPSVTLDRLRGWAAHEAIAAGVYVFVRHPDDVRAALLEGANTPGDSDSIATLAGALVGARVGLEGIPADWRERIEDSEELHTLAAALAAKTARTPASIVREVAPSSARL